MFFIDRSGYEIVTLCELFERKKFIKAIDSKYYFVDYSTGKSEIWTFVENLFLHIPASMSKVEIESLVSYSGWCKKIEI